MYAILTEHFAAKWPFWLSPRQVMVVPISDKAADYALEVKASLRAAGFHVDADLRDLKMQKKVREAQISYYNYILVCGEKEKEARTVNVRTRDNKVHGEHQLTSLVEVLAKEKSSRSLESLFESELAGELEKKLTVE